MINDRLKTRVVLHRSNSRIITRPRIDTKKNMMMNGSFYFENNHCHIFFAVRDNQVEYLMHENFVVVSVYSVGIFLDLSTILFYAPISLSKSDL